jgi:hypothetical protein
VADEAPSFLAKLYSFRNCGIIPPARGAALLMEILSMRTTFCILAFLIAGVATAVEPPEAVHKNDSCKAAGVANTSESPIDFWGIKQRELDNGRRAPFKPISMSEGSDDFCYTYKIIRYYTDASYTDQCGSLFFLCEGLVGSGGPCRTQFYTVEERCECNEEV